MRRHLVAILVGTAFVTSAIDTTVYAQAQLTSTTSDVSQRFVVEFGGFETFVSTNLQVNSATFGGTTVNFEHDLNLPSTAQRGYVNAYWRIKSRHELSVSFSRLNRTGSGVTISRDIDWNGLVFPAGVNVAGVVDSSFWAGAYRFALYHRRRFELGPSLGFGYLTITAGLNSTFSIGNVQGQTMTTTLTPRDSSPSVTGDIGAFANWWLARRLYVRTDFRYILVKPMNETESVTEGRANLTWYLARHFGIGGQYTYDKFRSDRSILSATLGGSYRYEGLQLLGSVAF